MSKFEELLKRTCQEYPGFRVVERDKSWLRPIFWVLGKLTRTDYSTFTTTIGRTMYVGATWASKNDVRKYKTLRHEKVHTKQFMTWPFGRKLWPVNYLLMGLCYLLVLPVLWTFRAKFEREGYTQTLLFDYEEMGTISDERMEDNARWMAKTFGTSMYAWMWTGSAAYRWAMVTQRAIINGEITNDADRVDSALRAKAAPVVPSPQGDAVDTPRPKLPRP